jgi:LPS sulfotransferase NodH
MGWRKRLALSLMPGLATGVTFGDWVRLLWDNGFRVAPACWPRAANATARTLINTPLRWLESALYGRRIARQQVASPLFVLGHWRSGTTLLQNLLAADPRFASPSYFQVSRPHHFLLTERPKMWLARRGASPTTRVLDNVALHPEAPAEEEFALARTTFLSIALCWAFPRRADRYDRYLTFRGVPEHEVRRWQAAFGHLARKLTLRYGRPLIFKSPHNTARVRLLLEVFPGARFVHIRRDPYVVYQSTRRMNRIASEWFAFQTPDPGGMHERVLRRYREMYDAYLAEKSLIPAGRLAEVSYEELEADPLGQLERVYRELSLPDFEQVRPAVAAYVRSLEGYKKNQHPSLADEVRADIAREWRRFFDAWGYPV